MSLMNAPVVSSRRLLAASDPSLATHNKLFGPLVLSPDINRAIAELQASGLDGRGGAGFPAWRKITAAHTRAAAAAGPIVVANGSEGEPLSSKDAVLLERSPHLVIDGLLAVGRLLGASELHLVTTDGRVGSVHTAIAERDDARGIRVHTTSDSFVSGEASAVAHLIEKGKAIPRDHVVRLTVRGIRGVPTLIHNVETLAQVSLILRFGSRWFSALGSPDDPGTRLVTISGDVPSPGVVEVPGGTPLNHVLALAGADSTTVRAVLVGGYHGGWVPDTDLHTPLSRAALEPFGASPGAGVLMVLGRGRCGLSAGSLIADYLATQSARQCGPCVNGLPAMASVLSRLAAARHEPGLDQEVRRLADLVTGRGSCHHPDGTARLVLSTLTAFAADVAAHQQGYCSEVHS